MCPTCLPSQKAKVPKSWRPTVIEMTDLYISRAGYTSEMCDGCRFRLYVWLRRRGLPSLIDVAMIVWVLKQRAGELKRQVRERSGHGVASVGARV
jgi:hypothetical protein